jgi:hypothetical protein
MSPVSDSLQRFQIVFDLFDAAEDLMRQNILRADPHATEQEIEAKIIVWLQDRPSDLMATIPGFRTWCADRGD